jgi:putative transposase
LPLQNESEIENRKHRRQMLLPKIIGRLKMNSAKQINQIRNTPGVPVWQRNYYEHIIRDEPELHAIREYIRYNPLKWGDDEENPEYPRK